MICYRRHAKIRVTRQEKRCGWRCREGAMLWQDDRGAGRPPRPTLDMAAAATGAPPSPPASPTTTYYYFEGVPPVVTPAGIPEGPGGPLFLAYPSKASEFMFKQFEGFKDFTMNTAKSGLSVGEKASFWMYGKVSDLSKRWFTHMFLFLVVAGYSFLGGFLFQHIEGHNEARIIRDMYLNRRDLANHILQEWKDLKPENESEELLWLGRASQAIREYEGMLKEFFKKDSSILAKGSDPEWDYWASVFYCGTIYTTIGYGHIAPATTTGKALTIVYAIIGIPMFLILLADFGKLFTRAIKWVWAFVRRLYYTGSCKKVRKTGPVQEVMKGVQLVYDMAAFRRPSSAPQPGEDGSAHQAQETVPSTPAPSAFVIDEEFNLPISLAIFMLVLYIFCGAVVFWIWEEWSFFDSFYFVFISMSTIGFGDLVPQNKMYMMASIVYLAFGLALTSMCINVVQEKLSDSFRQASAKIGATIGLKVKGASGEEVDLSPGSLSAAPVELALVHKTLTPTSPTNV